MSGQSWSLLSITDPHYEAPETNLLDDAKELEYWEYRESALADFRRILESGFPGRNFDLIAIGGDITTHGKKPGFDKFLEQAVLPIQRLVKTHEAVCIVPGNHDVTWKLDPYATGSFRTKFADFRSLVKKARATSCLFPEGELTRETDSTLSLLAPEAGPIYSDPDRKILVLCINSSIRCGELSARMVEELDVPSDKALKAVAKTRGAAKTNLTKLREALPKYLIRDVAHVTQPQRNALADLLGKFQREHSEDWASYLRVAIVHHHLVHFQGQILEHKGYELMVDSADVLGLLADFDFDLVLTGHKHQPYAELHNVGGKEMLIIGGPTVGGGAPSEAFRGLRWIQVFDHGDHRSFEIRNIPNSVGKDNVSAKIAKLQPLPAIHCRRPPDLALERHTKEAGFSYREMASITTIGDDGDARRIIECEDLVVTAENHPRRRQHQIKLPSTSGSLTVMRASGRGFTVRASNLPIGKQNADVVLEFDEDIGSSNPASYTYQWYAINAFALDKVQFDYKYGRDSQRLNDIEFTHFHTSDPVRDLTVIVRFPAGFQLKSPPRLRIAKVDPTQPDARKWEIAVEARDRLSKAYALRFFESLNIAALRVPFPQPELSYGIQWEVPDVPNTRAATEPEVKEFRTKLARRPLGKAARALLMEALVRTFVAMRRSLIVNWDGPVDGSFMYFDGDRSMPVLVAAEQQHAASSTKELIYSVTMKYGDGIAGRAFKANQPRVYVEPNDTETDEPAYYMPIEGAPVHKVLLCLPTHRPVSKQTFDSRPGIYSERAPFGVISLGSDNGACPLSAFRLPERRPELLRFQHDANQILYAALKSAFPDGGAGGGDD